MRERISQRKFKILKFNFGTKIFYDMSKSSSKSSIDGLLRLVIETETNKRELEESISIQKDQAQSSSNEILQLKDTNNDLSMLHKFFALILNKAYWKYTHILFYFFKCFHIYFYRMRSKNKRFFAPTFPSSLQPLKSITFIKLASHQL